MQASTTVDHLTDGKQREACACDAGDTGSQGAHASRVTDEALMLGGCAHAGHCSDQSNQLHPYSGQVTWMWQPRQTGSQALWGCACRAPPLGTLCCRSCLCQCWPHPLRGCRGRWLTPRPGTPTCKLPCEHANDLRPTLWVLQSLYQHLPAEQGVPHAWRKRPQPCAAPRPACRQNALHKVCKHHVSW